MKHNEKQLLLMETVARKSWPAETALPYEEWILRANDGVSKRANSVFTVGAMPHKEGWLTHIEQFYEKHNITPCFYISECSPRKLAEMLEKHHYEKVGEVYIMSASCERIIAETKDQVKFTVKQELNVSDEWIHNFLELEEFSQDSFQAYKKIFSNINIPKMFLTLSLDGVAVAVGTVTVFDKLGYISNVVVSKNHRRQGIAIQLLRELAIWAHNNHCEMLFLQVVTTNTPAIHLYDRLQFDKIAKSHYRIKK